MPTASHLTTKLLLLLAFPVAFPVASAWGQEPIRDLTGAPLSVESLVDALALEQPPPVAKTRGLSARRALDCSKVAKTRGVDASHEPQIAAIEVLFEIDSDQLTDAARHNLDLLGQALSSDVLRQCCILIEGHTDATGSETHNQGLSQRRAQQVKLYLEQHQSIEQQRLRTQGLGESRPIADNEGEEGRRRNRRVQIVNLGYGADG